MYRIMIVDAEKGNWRTQYRFMTTTDSEGAIVPVELQDEAALDAYVEKLLNEDGYAKKDFIIVKPVEYVIDAKDYTEVAAAVDDYILWQKSKIGRDINPSELTRRMVNAGAKRVAITHPAFAAAGQYEVAVCGTRSVTYGGLEDD